MSHRRRLLSPTAWRVGRAALQPLVLILALSLAYPSAATPARDGAPPVYRCNYDLRVEIDGETHTVHHQDSVRGGSYIPIHLGKMELQIAIGQRTQDAVEVTVTLLKVSAVGQPGDQLTRHQFSMPLGAPVTEKWRDGEVSIDAALSVSVVGR